MENLEVLDPTGTVRLVAPDMLGEALRHGGFYANSGKRAAFRMPDGRVSRVLMDDAP